MLDQILQTLTIDKILYYFKEQSLTFNAQKNINSSLLTHKNNSVILKLSDSDILKNILPNELSSQMFTQGHVTLLSFIFALRHKITICNLLFHISSLQNSAIKHDMSTNFSLFPELNLESLYEEFYPLCQPEFWGPHSKLPIIGFSAVGCLFSWQNIGNCRAFDHYDILNCPNKGEDIFCNEHSSENFWSKNLDSKASTQAKMFHFYFHKSNFKEYDEEALTKLLGQFYHKFQSEFKSAFSNHNFSDQSKILPKLKFYNFDSLNELKQNGHDELRKRFLEKAKILHPDCGGSQELFREARTIFEHLREYI